MLTTLIARKVESSEGNCRRKYEQTHRVNANLPWCAKENHYSNFFKFPYCLLIYMPANVICKDGKDNIADTNF